MSNELTDVRCPCGAEFQADSYDAGFIAGSGMCQNCDAALPPKDICTCPSGDGSLVHPCPAHPAPVEQAGGDERAAFEAWWQSAEVLKCKRDVAMEAWQARAALAQPSQAPTEGFTHFPELLESVQQMDAMLKANSAQAEAERPEVVAWRYGFSGGIVSDKACLDEWKSGGEYQSLMTVAQHERIVKAWIERWKAYIELSAKIAAQRDAANARLHEVATACATAEQERDATLARVAELERGKVYVEARRCDECQHDGINDSATGVAACHECDWTGPEPEEDKCPGCQRENCMAAACPQCGARYVLVASEEIAAPVAQAQQLHDLDKQCRDDVARALGLRPSQERGFAWSYLLASIKSCVKASEDAAQAQHSVPELDQLYSMLGAESQVDAAKKIAELIGCRMSRSALTEAQMRRIYENSTEIENERLGFAAFARLMRRAEAVHQIAAAPGKEGL